jgi:hypothetical protein
MTKISAKANGRKQRFATERNSPLTNRRASPDCYGGLPESMANEYGNHERRANALRYTKADWTSPEEHIRHCRPVGGNARVARSLCGATHAAITIPWPDLQDARCEYAPQKLLWP